MQKGERLTEDIVTIVSGCDMLKSGKDAVRERQGLATCCRHEEREMAIVQGTIRRRSIVAPDVKASRESPSPLFVHPLRQCLRLGVPNQADRELIGP